MTFGDYVKSYFRNLAFYPNVFNCYRKTFKNFFRVLFKSYRKEFPFTATLKNGEQKTFVSSFDIGATSSGFKDWYEIDDNIVTIKKEKFNRLKFYDAINNGDIATVFFNEEYNFLPVIDKDVIDIGANIGDSSIYFAVQGAKRVIAVEPFPINYNSAKKNIETNNLSDKIHLLHAGCSERNGSLRINSSQKGGGSSLIKTENGTEIPLITLEDILEKFNIKSAILKIDCEGCEYDVILSSSKKTLQKFPDMFIEYHYGYKNLKEKLENCGFKVIITEPPIFYNNPELKYTKTYMGAIHAHLSHMG